MTEPKKPKKPKEPLNKKPKVERYNPEATLDFDSFKGNAMVVLKRDPEDKYPFQFGISKAKLVVDLAKNIEAWIKKMEPDANKFPVDADSEDVIDESGDRDELDDIEE